jgi:hypothetical protein
MRKKKLLKEEQRKRKKENVWGSGHVGRGTPGRTARSPRPIVELVFRKRRKDLWGFCIRNEMVNGPVQS